MRNRGSGSDHRSGAGWGRGAEGQRATAAALAALPTSSQYFHGLAVGRTGDEVDHLVVGPSGVWVVNSAVWHGLVTVTADGMLWRDRAAITTDIEAMQERAAYARRTLGHEVRPVLCVVGTTLPGPSHRIAGVDIVGVDWLVALITAQPDTLDRSVIDAVLAAAAGWRAQPPDHRHPARPVAATSPRGPVGRAGARSRSESLRSALRETLRRRTAAETGALALAATIAVTMLALIGYLVVRDDGPDRVGADTPAVEPDAAPFRVEIRCPTPGRGYELIGRVGSLTGGVVRVSAELDGVARYLGEFRPLDRTAPIWPIPPSTTTGFDVQTVDDDGIGGDVRHLDIVTPDAEC